MNLHTTSQVHMHKRSLRAGVSIDSKERCFLCAALEEAHTQGAHNTTTNCNMGTHSRTRTRRSSHACTLVICGIHMCSHFLFVGCKGFTNTKKWDAH